MRDTYEVISAFLDDEAFDPGELARALTEPDGRALLIDLLALRGVMQPGKEAIPVERPRRPTALRALAAAAALVMALVGGYVVGQRQGETEQSEAPPATRVVEAPATWQALP